MSMDPTAGEAPTAEPQYRLSVGFDGDIFKVRVSGGIDAQVEKPGSTTLPARRLANIVRELPAAEVMVEISDRVLVAAGLKPGDDEAAVAGAVASFSDDDEAPIDLQ